EPHHGSIGLVTASDISRLNINTLDFDIKIIPADVAEIPVSGVKIDNAVFPNATVTTTFDSISGIYHSHVTSTTFFPQISAIPFLLVPLNFFIGKDSSASLLIAAKSPEKEGCIEFDTTKTTIGTTN